jgi:hypothetical protein
VIHRWYLPLIARDFISRPDLIITRLTLTMDSVQVVIQNQGSAPVVDEFWIDLYVNPIPPPVAVNETWDDGRSRQGIVWAIANLQDPASQPLPLAPGASLTVTFGDVYMVDAYTEFAFPLTGETPVYAQVDSANALTNYGSVLETHEVRGGAYNNVFGPVYPTAATAPAVAGRWVRATPNPAWLHLSPRR